MVDLKELRENAGLTQEKLAAQVGVCRTMIANIERGSVRPSVKTAKKLGKILNVEWFKFF